MSFKNLGITGLLVALTMFLPYQVNAQEQAVEITGEIMDVDHMPFWQGLEDEPSFPLMFRALVVENTDAELDSNEGPVGGGVYIDSVLSITFEIYDGNETLLFTDSFNPPVTGGTGLEGGSATYAIPGESEIFFDFDNMMWIAAPPQESMDYGRVVSLGILSALFSGMEPDFPMPEEAPEEFSGELFADLSGYPLLIEGETFYPFQYLLFTPFSEEEQELEQESQSSGFYGIATFIQYIDLDADGDGVPDALDVCSPTILNENVEFASIDTGVPNIVDESGCSIMDHYAACQVEEEPVRGIRSVRRGPSNCEKAVSYDLVADGIISYAEARMLRDALYRASTSVADSPLYEGDN
ncbi:hypothetical protein [Pseudidiomarina aquimaris]|uniref:hypothetical protein n=1 Tax=Pseudidiomarina aquimaris TaxID=641841 RepID=UPI003A96A2E1